MDYQAKSWDRPEKLYAKVESTGKGMNIRYFASNFENMTARQIYFGFYVKRGDASENRIKELKNMTYADRLSCPMLLDQLLAVDDLHPLPAKCFARSN